MKGIVINEIGKSSDPILSTSIADYSLRYLEEDSIVLHLFSYEGINIGKDDMQIPNIKKGLNYFSQNNQKIILRQSGGRAIVSDCNTINMSLSFKNNQTAKENYLFYSQFIKDALAPLEKQIDVFEVVGAYCPGEFDMSIDGRKFCGTAQKRILNKAQMDCYIAVGPNQLERNNLIRSYYQSMNYPLEVKDSSMGSLSEIIQSNLTTTDVCKLIIQNFTNLVDDVIFISIDQLHSDKLNKSYDWVTRLHKRYHLL